MRQLVNCRWKVRQSAGNSGIRVYTTAANRARGIAMLRRLGYQYFTKYRDVAGFAISYAKTTTWLKPGEVYISN